MDELIREYEEETGLPALDPNEWECFGHEMKKFHTEEYVAWLSSRQSWHTEPPPKDNVYFCELYNDGDSWWNIVEYTNGWSGNPVIQWCYLPKPAAYQVLH